MFIFWCDAFPGEFHPGEPFLGGEAARDVLELTDWVLQRVDAQCRRRVMPPNN